VYGGSRTGALVRGPGRGKAGFEAGVSERKLAVVGDLDSGSVTGPPAYTPGDTVLGMPVEYLCVEQEARYGRWPPSRLRVSWSSSSAWTL